MGILDDHLSLIPADDLAAAMAPKGGSGWSPSQGGFESGGINYAPEIAFGQGSNGLGNDEFLGFTGSLPGQTSAGDPYANYDKSGKFTGMDSFKKVNNSVWPAIAMIGGAALGANFLFSGLGSGAGAGAASGAGAGTGAAGAAASTSGGGMGFDFTSMFGDLGGDPFAGDLDPGGAGSMFNDLGYEPVASADGGIVDPSGFDLGGAGSSAANTLSKLSKVLGGQGAGGGGGGGLFGGNNLSWLAPFLSGLVGGADANKSANTANDLAKQLIDRSDPFYQYRAGYGQKLQDLEASKDVTSIPGYQAGLEAVQRSGAAQGFTGSGNMMKSLQDYGGNFYNAELNRLGGLAGANVQPGAGYAAAAGLIGQGQASGSFGDQQYINALKSLLGGGGIGNGLTGVGNALSNLGAPGATGNPANTTAIDTGSGAPQGTDLGNYALA